jgi:hypothetical protein
VVDIEFLTEFGPLPLITANERHLVGNVTIRRLVKNSRDNLECSRLGTCDENTGKCKCIEGYVSDPSPLS